MIFGNINNLSEFPFLEEQVKECFEYAKTHDLASYEKGSYEIDGDRLFVNIVEYTTTTPEERFWEISICQDYGRILFPIHRKKIIFFHKIF